MAAIGWSPTARSGLASDPLGGMLSPPREELFAALVADDQPQLREAIAARLTSMGAGQVHEAGSVVEARACAYASGPCDVAVVALTLPGDPLELLAHLRSAGWPRVAVLANADDLQPVRQAIQSGAHAYLLKSAPARVADGVQQVLANGTAASTRVPAADETPRDLTAREVEVLQLVADGQSNKEIGAALALSSLTVKSHISRIGRKLSTGDRAEMVALAMRAGVIR